MEEDALSCLLFSSYSSLHCSVDMASYASNYISCDTGQCKLDSGIGVSYGEAEALTVIQLKSSQQKLPRSQRRDLTNLVHSCCACSVDEVTLLNYAVASGIEPEHFIFQVLLWTCLKRQHASAAVILFDDMVSRGITVTGQEYGCLLSVVNSVFGPGAVFTVLQQCRASHIYPDDKFLEHLKRLWLAKFPLSGAALVEGLHAYDRRLQSGTS